MTLQPVASSAMTWPKAIISITVQSPACPTAQPVAAGRALSSLPGRTVRCREPAPHTREHVVEIYGAVARGRRAMHTPAQEDDDAVDGVHRRHEDPEHRAEPGPPLRRAEPGGRDKFRASPKKASPKITPNWRMLYIKSQKIPIASPKLASLIKPSSSSD
jgi:hypothetical protein